MAAAIPAHKLPSSFTSLYRLFLRASSTAVLHHRTAKRHARTLWKPTFREAAIVIHKLQSPTLEISEKEKLERWRCLWERSSELQNYQAYTRYGSIRSWDPRQQMYKPARQVRPAQVQVEKFDGQSWGALEETARMAEGKSGLTLGRMEFRLRRA